MNWEKDRYTGFKPGDRIKVLKDSDFSSYKLGKIYTLKEQYIKDGIWIEYGDRRGDTSNEKYNYWDTLELDTGIEEMDFELASD